MLMISHWLRQIKIELIIIVYTLSFKFTNLKIVNNNNKFINHYLKIYSIRCFTDEFINCSFITLYCLF